KAICEIIDSESFWGYIKTLRNLLVPLCNALDKLQSNNARLFEVFHSFGYLVKLYKSYPDQIFGQKMLTRLERCWSIWEQPILILSFWLHPSYRAEKFDSNIIPRLSFSLKSWLLYYYDSWINEKPTSILFEFERYNQMKFPYSSEIFNQYKGDLLLYWGSLSRDNNELAKLACHIFGMCVNSAPVERLFSKMKLIHTPLRNRLHYEKVLKISQIHGDIINLKMQSTVNKLQTEDLNDFVTETNDHDSNPEETYQDLEEWQMLVDEWISMTSNENIDDEMEQHAPLDESHPAENKRAKWTLTDLFPADKAICEIIDSESFWGYIKTLRNLLVPLCNALDKLQSNNARLFEVFHSFGYLVKLYKSYPDQIFGQKMLTRLERCWSIWEQPILILSFWLHPSYRAEKFDSNIIPRLSFSLKSWLLYYYDSWINEKPTSILFEFERYNQMKFPYSSEIFNQYKGDLLLYWGSLSRDNNELAKLACHIFGMCVNSAPYEKVLKISQIHGDIINLKMQSTVNKLQTEDLNDFVTETNDHNSNPEETYQDLEEWQMLVDEWISMTSNENIDDEMEQHAPLDESHPAENKRAKWTLTDLFPAGLDAPDFIFDILPIIYND
ncbi:4926_t:CDS:2, partial [Entrophospora sp. SA101]